MTTYTAPRTWTTNELVTAAMLNEQLRDNTMHLDETKSELAATTYAYDSTAATTTSTSYADMSDALTITTTATSDIVCIATCQAKTSNTSYTATIALHNGTTQAMAHVLLNAAWYTDYHGYFMMAVLESAAAGDHVFKIQGLVNNAGNTLSVDEVHMVAFALSE